MYREAGARLGGSTVEAVALSLARAIEHLAQRVGRIEASNRTLPPDTVLEREDADGQLYVFMRRVSTDERWQIVPPAAPSDGVGGVTEEFVNDAIVAAINAIVFPPAGVSAAFVNDAIAAALTGYVPALPANVTLQETHLLGGGATGIYVVTHAFGDRDYIGMAYRATAPFNQIEVRIEHTDATTATVYISPVPAAGEVMLVLLGAGP